MKIIPFGCSHRGAAQADQWQRPVGVSVCLPDCAQIVSGCGPKPSIHRNYVMFDLVRSGFFIRVGFRMGWNVA